MPRLDPRGAHVVVTGASRGIGRALALEFGARGSFVTLVARSAAPIVEVADAIGGRACAADLGVPDVVEQLIGRIEVDSGRAVDVLVNNAGVAVVARCAEQDLHDIRRIFELNAVVPAQLTRQVLPGMLGRGRGAIANVGSLAGITAFPTLGAYGASKAALAQYTATLQRELRNSGVTATMVQLGEVAGTDMMEESRRSPTIAAVSARLDRVHAMPRQSPEAVAARIVDAVARGARTLVLPARVAAFHAVREFPSRLNDLLLWGID
jgi:short-subunit dehydrogenase